MFVGVLVPVLIFSAGIAASGSAASESTASTVDASEASEVLPTATVTSSHTPAGPSQTPSSTPVPDSPAQTALDQLARLIDAPAGYLDGYDRDSYGYAWMDVDRNGCDTRNDILDRDLTAITYKAGTHDCVVLSGDIDDPYTGISIAFVRGGTTSTLVQIDHIVPLGYSWQVGAAEWTEDQKSSFANDPSNLLAVDGHANQVKSADGPSEWMPSNLAFHCEYVELFVGNLFVYELEIKAEDRITSQQVLESCV